MFGIALLVAFNLTQPIGGVGLWGFGASGAVMTMPEASMDKNRRFPPDKSDIWLARQVPTVKTIAALTDCTASFSDSYFCGGVFAFHAPHCGSALGS